MNFFGFMHPIKRVFITGMLAGVCLFLLAACSFSAVDVQQEEATGLASELLDGHAYGQTILPHEDGLCRIDLYTATYARTNSKPVIFRVRTTQDAAGDLVRIELPAKNISNSGPTIINFPPLIKIADQRLYMSVESPGSVPGDAVTVYRSDKDVYPDGQMYVDGKPTEGDLAFITYSCASFTAADIWNDFSSRAGQDIPFFIGYGLLLSVVLTALVIVIRLPSAWWQKPNEKDETEFDAGKNHDG